MMRCIAIDDEKLALDLLEDNIRQVPFLQLAARCRNVMEAMEVLSREKIDLIFLDIQMPGITGLQFLQSLPERPLAIFVTAYNNHALEGFDMDAIDYLVKPVSFERFLKACNKAYEYYKPRNKPADIVSTGRDYFFVNVEYNQVKLNYHDIRYIEAMKDYVRIHLVAGKPIVTRQSMKAIEEKLPAAHFVRVHKSYIVSIDKIQAIKRGLIVINNNELPLGDNYKTRFDCLLGIVSE